MAEVAESIEASIEEKNELIGQQLIKLIGEIHREMRPFVLIFPVIDGDRVQTPQAMTNISNVPYVRTVLKQHLRALKQLDEFNRIPRSKLLQ